MVPAAAQAGASASLSRVCWGKARRATAAQRRAVAPSPEETSQECGFPGGLRRGYFRVALVLLVRAISSNNAPKYLQEYLS